MTLDADSQLILAYEGNTAGQSLLCKNHMACYAAFGHEISILLHFFHHTSTTRRPGRVDVQSLIVKVPFSLLRLTKRMTSKQK